MSKRNIIWIGLDVHAASITVARFDGYSEKPIVSEMPNETKAIKKFLGKLAEQGELRVCYEAGPTGYTLARELHAMSIDCAVVAPSLVPKKEGERVKTDRRDAIKLAEFYRSGHLTSVWVPSVEDEANRDLVRARDDARNDRTAARNRLQKFLLRHGRRFGNGTGWTQKYWAWVASQKFDNKTQQLVFDRYVAHVKDLDERVKEFDKHIAALAMTEPYRARVARLMTLRGIGMLSAMVILTELYDLRRFKHPRQMMSFVGIVPSEHSSGGKDKRFRITKTGNIYVRRILTEASWHYGKGSGTLMTRQREALKTQPAEIQTIARKATERLTRRFHRLSSRKLPKGKVCTAVARELCGFVWALENAAA